MTPPFIPPPLSDASTDGPQQDTPEVDPALDTSSPPPADYTPLISPPAGPPQPPSLTVQTAVAPSGSPSSSPSSQPNSDQSGSFGSGSDESVSNASSLEIVGYDTVSEGWDADRRRGVPLDERITHERRRLLTAESTTNLLAPHHASSSHVETSYHPDASSVHGLCTHCGSPKPSSINERQLPAPASPDLTEYEPDGFTPPSSPKSRKGWKKLLQPIIPHDSKSDHEPASPLSPTPRSPTTGTFTFLQSAWSSTLTLASSTGGSPSKATGNSSPSSVKRRESSGVRRLFASKGKERDKERDWSPPAHADVDDEPWEVVNRASVLWAEEQERKGKPRPMSSISELGPERGPISPASTCSRSALRVSPSSPHTTPFLNRPLRHPAMNGSSLTLPLNQSVVSLQPSTAAGPGANRPSPASDPGVQDIQSQKKAKRPPPPPPPPRRKAVSTTAKPSSSAVRLPPIDTQAAASVRSYAEVASPTQTMASPTTATTATALYMPRPYPSLPTLRPSSRDGVETRPSLPSPLPSAGVYGTFDASASAPVQNSDAISIVSSHASIPSPMTYNHNLGRIAPPVMILTDSFSTISLDSPSTTPPRTPTTPTHPHHYPGRPLPQPPRPQPPRQPQLLQLSQLTQPSRQPSPLRTAAAVASPVSPAASTPAISPISNHSPFTDLDVLASRVIEGDHNGRNYEVCSFNLSQTWNIKSRFAGPPAHLRVRSTRQLSARPLLR